MPAFRSQGANNLSGLRFSYGFDQEPFQRLSLVFAGCAIWMLKHGAPDEGFKWAAGIAGTIVGALLMKMQVKDPKDQGQ